MQLFFLLLCSPLNFNYYSILFHSYLINIQDDPRVIMNLTKFVMQPTIHVPHNFLVCVFIDYST
jgi:hypothetical protein